MPKFYITTPIYYPSSNLHIGHTYCTVMADAMARFKRLAGYDVMFLTGTDEHGQKIQRIAEAAGITPQEHVDGIVAGVKELWATMEISYDDFIRTTEERHKTRVQEIFRMIYEAGDIYKGVYEGWYCAPCESYWTDKQLVGGACPDCGRPAERMSEESYFFRLSKYADKLLALFETNPSFLEPETRRNEMVQFIKQGLEDLNISRGAFDWGIKVPIDEGQVIYVWLDALSNYVTALGYPAPYGGVDDGIGPEKYEKYWPADVHLVGKEIVRFHSIIWPALLMSAGLPLPKQVLGHGWLLLEGGKMSKSRGNVVDPVKLIGRYGVDALKYFLLREYTFGQDGLYTNEVMLNRINGDLANDLGNLLSRTCGMAEKYFGGRVARPEGAPGAGAGSPAGAAAAGNPAPEAGDLAPGGVNLASAAAGDPADAAEAGGDSAPGAGNPVPAEGGADAAGGVNPALGAAGSPAGAPEAGGDPAPGAGDLAPGAGNPVPAEGGADAAGGVNPASASGGGDPADAAAAGGDPAPEAGDPESAEGVNPVDAALIRLATGVADKVEAHMEKFGFSHALEQIWALVGASNKYIDETAPWALAKDETQRARLETVLYNLCEALRVVSVLIHPFMHHSADEIRSQLGGGSAGPGVGVLGGGSCGGDGVAWEDAKVFGKVAVYNVVKGDALFPRIDVAKELEALEAL